MYSRMVQTRYVYVLKCDVKTSMLHFYNEKLSFNFQERWGGGGESGRICDEQLFLILTSLSGALVFGRVFTFHVHVG